MERLSDSGVTPSYSFWTTKPAWIVLRNSVVLTHNLQGLDPRRGGTVLKRCECKVYNVISMPHQWGSDLQADLMGEMSQKHRRCLNDLYTRNTSK